jgi:hypothetical protein
MPCEIGGASFPMRDIMPFRRRVGLDKRHIAFIAHGDDSPVNGDDDSALPLMRFNGNAASGFSIRLRRYSEKFKHCGLLWKGPGLKPGHRMADIRHGIFRAVRRLFVADKGKVPLGSFLARPSPANAIFGEPIKPFVVSDP